MIFRKIFLMKYHIPDVRGPRDLRDFERLFPSFRRPAEFHELGASFSP